MTKKIKTDIKCVHMKTLWYGERLYFSSRLYIDPPDKSSHLGESTYCWSGSSSSTDWSFRWTNSASASVMQLAVEGKHKQTGCYSMCVCVCVWALIATAAREVWVCREMCVWAPCSAEGCMTIDLWRPKRLDCHRGVPLAAVRLSFSLFSV
jgi:hypothetical protein